jgi:hypothetical protein
VRGVLASSAAAVPTAVPPSALTGRDGLVRFNVGDVQARIRAGMVDEDATTELLDGYIVHTDRSAYGGDPTAHSPAHRYSVRRLTALSATIDSPERNVQVQLPIICGPRQMPEPDFAIIRGPDTDYADRLPTAADAPCVIEVADSSLERDRDEKLPKRVRAGVPQYVILNLRNRTAEVYTEPDRAAGTYVLTVFVAVAGAIKIYTSTTSLFRTSLKDACDWAICG